MCSIEGCAGKVNARGWCGKHYMRWRAHGDPLMVKYRHEDAGYDAAHWRTRKDRGPAREHTCRHCPESAKHWALSHDAPVGQINRDKKGRYSLNPANYLPLCYACHSDYDGTGFQNIDPDFWYSRRWGSRAKEIV